MLNEVFSKEDQEAFLSGLQEFNEEAKKEYGEEFNDLDDEDQAAFVKKLHDAAINAESDTDETPKRPFVLHMKELTLLGFFTSEAGATQVLQYVAVPGAYKGCIPLSEAGNGRTWAT